jgi:hypothetical protein
MRGESFRTEAKVPIAVSCIFSLRRSTTTCTLQSSFQFVCLFAKRSDVSSVL